MNRFLCVVILAAALSLFGAKDTGLVGYWTFDGSDANDFTGNHHGTVIGDGVTFPAGLVGNAANFSVGSSFIKIPSFNTDHITVEAWVNSASYGYYTSMVTKNYYADKWSSPWTTWSLWFSENTANPGTISSQWATASPEAVLMNEWHHMAFTYDGTTVKMYVNGVEKNSYEPAGGPITQTDGNVYIGKPEYANHSFTGSIDEVAIWDNALSGTEILRHYQNGLAGIGYLTAPTVQTDSVTNVTLSSATVMSEVVSENGSEVTERGVCWNETGNPTISDSRTFEGTGTGEFTSTITGLYAGRDYYVRSYAVNSTGTSYGDELIFSTPDNPEGLVAYYPFNGNVNDESGYGNNAVNYGATPAEDRYDSLNSAFSFNGSSNYMMIGNPVPEVLQIQNEITLSAWIYLTSYPGSSNLGLIIGSQTDYTFSGATIHIDGRTNSDGQPSPPGHIHFQIGDGSWHVTNTQTQVPLNQWVLITATRKANEDAKIYYNNVLQPLQSDPWTGNITYNSAWMMMGRQQDYGDRYFNGIMDEVRVYNRALTEDEVDQLYANYLPPENFTAIAENGYNKLSWDTSDYQKLEKVKVFRNGVFLNEVIIDGPEDSLFTDNEVIPDSMYQYCISSVDTLGNESIKSNIIPVTAFFIPFTDINAGIEGVIFGSIAWGDYDNDGDLDILLNGYDNDQISEIYRNDEGSFVDINAGLYPLHAGNVEWGDYDNDGDLDVLITGHTGVGDISMSKVYRNDAGTFNDISAGLTGVIYYAGSSWGDYDNDGDLDIIISGRTSTLALITKIYENNSGTFTDINAGIASVIYSSIDWGDFDNDGDLDLLLTGSTTDHPNYTQISKIYRNDSGSFTDIEAGLPGVFCSQAIWGDYDNDGDLDILLTGNTGSSRIAKIYKNTDGTFSDAGAVLTGIDWCSADWGDFDNDGDLDIILTGDTGSGYISKIYRNDSGVFTDIEAGFPGVYCSSAAWGDYDNDGDLDLLMTGSTGSGNITKIYRNNSLIPNTIPSSPSNLDFVQDDNGLHFNVDPATDAETPAPGLSYNINIDIGDGIIKSASSDLTTGYKRIPSMGNVQQNTSWTLNIEAPPEIIPQQVFDMVWKVQAVDNCFAGSSFASKNDIVMTRDLITVPKETMVASDALTWEYYMPADSIAGYTLQLSGDSLFADCFEAFMPKAKDNKAVYIGIDLLSLGVTDSLVNNERYFWRVKPEHVNPVENPTGFKKVPDSFIYDPVFSAPSPINIEVMGEFVILTWNNVKDAGKGEVYNVYSSDDPYAVFPDGWSYEANVNGTEWTVKTSELKKFYCVTAAGSVK